MVMSFEAQVDGLAFDRNWATIHYKRMKEKTSVQIQTDFDFGRK